MKEVRNQGGLTSRSPLWATENPSCWGFRVQATPEKVLPRARRLGIHPQDVRPVQGIVDPMDLKQEHDS